MKKVYTLIGLDRQSFNFGASQSDQYVTFSVIASTEREALSIGRKTHACTVVGTKFI